ncbi:hypothetical protein MKW92_005269 [Papaver armeniacum]|nr:hypothetical protein MKW92_005269 [Papaver armeniacum]
MVFETYTTSKMKMKKEMKMTKEMRKEMKKCDNATEFTFVLGMPLVFLRGYVGVVSQEFTNIGLKLIGLRCMSVTAKFVNAHYQRKGRKTYTGPATDFVNRGPFLAMILQGVQAVNKAQELVSSKKEPPFWDRWKENMMFALPADNNLSKNVKEVLETKNLMLEVPAGNVWGGSTEEKLKYIVHSKKIDFTLERANQRFLLIKPKAVQDGIMPKLLSTIEKKFLSLPACMLFGEDSAHIRERDLVYLGTEGESLELIKEFFQFGVVGWKDPTIEQYCGGLFESTLTGLQFEDKEDLEKFL